MTNALAQLLSELETQGREHDAQETEHRDNRLNLEAELGAGRTHRKLPIIWLPSPPTLISSAWSSASAMVSASPTSSKCFGFDNTVVYSIDVY